MVNFVRSAIYSVAFYLGSVFHVVATCCFIPFGGRALILIPRAWAQYHYWCVRWLLGIRVQVVGDLPQTGVIIAMKHQAFLETTEVLRLLDCPAVVFKAELLRIPLWGRVALAHGVIPVARETGATALRRMLTSARGAVAAGRPIVIFPEGTRVPYGESPPLRPGVAGLYKSLGLPIVPVALDSGRLWPKQGFSKSPGVVTLLVGETIPTGLTRDEVEARIHAAVNALTPNPA